MLKIQTDRPFDPNCIRCPRLAKHLEQLRLEHRGYHCQPVATWGARSSRLLIVGLAPGLHGANRTGRPFIGDDSGITLFDALCTKGFAERKQGEIFLRGCRITNAVRCLPPMNRPTAIEIKRCNPYLRYDLNLLLPESARKMRVVVALGKVSYEAVSGALGLNRPLKFSHGRTVLNVSRRFCLLASYHPSRYNVNTGRLTLPMLEDVFDQAAKLLL